MHGALSDDEWRAQDNDNPLPDGKGRHYYVPLNLGKVEDVAERASAARNRRWDNREGADVTETAIQSLRQVLRRTDRARAGTDGAAVAQCESLREIALLKFQQILAKDAARMIHHEIVAVRRIAKVSPSGL